MIDAEDRATADMVAIEHKPITPPRKGHDGEAAYLQLWQRFMERVGEKWDGSDDHPLEDFYRNTNYKGPTQRQASVAASFVMWLGTNCGRALILEADRAPIERNSYRQSLDLRYLRRWELENRRELGVNGGLRLCEHILWQERGTGQELDKVNAPTITVDDLDVIEVVCRWLATTDGQHFLKAAEAAVEATNRARYLFGERA